MDQNKTCDQPAKFQIVWGGKNCNYCPAHANQLVYMCAQVNFELPYKRLPLKMFAKCESVEPLNEHEQKINDNFKD